MAMLIQERPKATTKLEIETEVRRRLIQLAQEEQEG